MNKVIAVDSPEFAAAPRTIRNLIVEADTIGGEVVMIADRLFEFALPCRMVSGITRLVNRTTVGYYVRDGKNIISNSAHETRREIAYWGKQARR